MVLAAVIVVALAAIAALAVVASRASARATKAEAALASTAARETEATARVAGLEAELAAAEAMAREAEERAGAAEAAREAAIADAAAERERAGAIERRTAAARRRAGALEQLVGALWELELLRQSRVWTALTAGMPGPSVAADTGAELAAALEMELQRLREEGGVPGELVKADVGDVPVSAALSALRLAQELIAGLGRSSDWLNVTAQVRNGELVVAVEADGQAHVPSVVRDLAARTGATVGGSGHTAEVRVRLA